MAMFFPFDTCPVYLILNITIIIPVIKVKRLFAGMEQRCQTVQAIGSRRSFKTKGRKVSPQFVVAMGNAHAQPGAAAPDNGIIAYAKVLLAGIGHHPIQAQMIAHTAQFIPVGGKTVAIASGRMTAIVVDIEHIRFGFAIFHLDNQIALALICPRLQQTAGFHAAQIDDIVERGFQRFSFHHVAAFQPLDQTL